MKSKIEYDLLAINIVAILLIITIGLFPSNVLRIILGLPFLLFFPGYSLVAALFPKKASLDSIEIIALGFCLSLAVVPLTGFVLNFTPWGIKLYPILLSLFFLILLFSATAWYRRQKLPAEEKSGIRIDITLPRWAGLSPLNKSLCLVLAVSILTSMGALGYLVSHSHREESFTEFYLLGQSGEAVSSLEIGVGETGEVELVIMNHELEQVKYRIEVEADADSVEVKIEDQPGTLEVPRFPMEKNGTGMRAWCLS